MFEKQTGHRSFYYGNFNRDHTQWTSYPAEGRYGTTYVGLRNRLSILAEAYSRAPYKTRVLATRDFVLECLRTAVRHKAAIVKLLAQAGPTSGRGRGAAECAEAVSVPIRSRPKKAEKPAKLLGFVEREENGRRLKTDIPKDYTVQVMNEFEATESVTPPAAYLIPASCTEVIATLQRHGLALQELREDIELDLEAYKIDVVEKSPRRFEGHNMVELTVSARTEARMVPAGTIMVRTAGPLGTLAVYLLEPRSEDGLAAWNFFDTALKPGADFPVARLMKMVPITLSEASPLAETVGPPRPITFDTPGAGGGRRRRGFDEAPPWLDGEHWLAVRGAG